MSVHVHETIGSRALTAGIDKGSELEWHLTVTGNASSLTLEVVPAMDAVFPLTVLDPVWGVTLVRGRFTVANPSRGVWQGKMVYIDPSRADDITKIDVGEWRFEISTTGGTARVFGALWEGTPSSPPVNGDYGEWVFAKSGATPTRFKGAIGVSGDPCNGEVAGVELAAIPAQRMTIHYRQPKAIITTAYVATCRKLTGSKNSAVFFDAAAGESLFMGADLAQGINSDPTCAYHFLTGENKNGISIGEITNITKDAFQYLWIWFKPEKDSTAKATRKIPDTVVVNDVYPDGDFSELAIGDGT